MEVSLGVEAELDFTELLDDLLAASQEAEQTRGDDAAVPALRVDMLAQIERLRRAHGLSAARAMREYMENAADPVELARAGVDGEKAARPAPDLQPALDDLFFLDPESISRELGIDDGTKPAELDRARRSFALRYHPDRVPEAMRERAALRMQIANMLIDEAKRRKR